MLDIYRRAFIRRVLQCSLTGWLGLSGAWTVPLSALPATASPSSARIALIIDDVGFSRRVIKPFLAIPVDLTFSILPHLQFSNLLAHEIHSLGFEILLHQPMEPFDPHVDPGPGAVYVSDRSERIEDMIANNIHAVPHTVGVNNHMGSRFTSSRREIQIALQAMKREGLFFIDSLTSHRSCAYLTARRINMTTGRRNAFLDNTRQPANILQRLYHRVDHALFTGAAIGIGHPFPETAMAIRQFCSEIQGTGVNIVPISRVLAPSASSFSQPSPAI